VAVIIAIAALGSLPSRLDATIDGAVLYRRDCARCHGPHGRGDGPDAVIFTSPPRDLRTEFLTKYSTPELVRRVRRGSPLQLDIDPKAVDERKREVSELVAYLQRLPTIDWRLEAIGVERYAERCQPCHGSYGHPAPEVRVGSRVPRNLTDASFRSLTDEELRLVVRHGREGMRKLSPPLGNADAAAVAAHVRLLSPGFELYERFCANCHGEDGLGTATAAALKGPAPVVLNAAYFSSHDAKQVGDAVWHMMAQKKPQMPHLRREVSETAAHAIIGFLKSLQR
jgi:mono/diheme cytochrome c family protein